MRAREFIEEDLRKWFKEKWVRFGPDGKIRGSCAREKESEGKPKCLPQSKAHALGKKGRASAASRKRREDPNPERKGKAKNVKTVTENNGTDHQKIMHHADDEPITVSNVNGQITVSSKHGEVKAYVKNDAVVVTGSFVKKSQRGQGYGVDLYEVLANTAFSLGKVLVSDRSVTVQAAGAWRALARRGYTVWANYVEGSAPDRVGGGGASPMGLNPFVAIPPGMDLTYAQAVSKLLSPRLRTSQEEMADEIDAGAVKLSGMKENFADGQGPGRPGDSARVGIPKNATIAQLKKIRSDPNSSKRKKQLAHWQINMRQGKKKS